MESSVDTANANAQ